MGRRSRAKATKKTKPVVHLTVSYFPEPTSGKLVCEHDGNRWVWTRYKSVQKIPADVWEAILEHNPVIRRRVKLEELKVSMP